MSAAVAQRNSPHMPRTSSRNQSPMDKKANVKQEAEPSKDSSSKPKDNSLPIKPEPSATKPENRKDNQPATSNAEASQPLAPPPKKQEGSDYFTGTHGNSHYSLEPNLFEQSFGNPPETPGKSLLPPVASLTSPQLLTGSASLGSGYNWTGSLRSGPLSPAMLSGPTGSGPSDYFDSSLRGSFPTPNESSLRTGLTPGGGGSMFPAPSPNTQALFNSIASGGATPNTLEFQRAAAASKIGTSNANSQSTQAPTTRAQTSTMGPTAQATANSQTFAHHDNEAANGLYLLAQAGNESQANNQFAVPNQPAHVNQDKGIRAGSGSATGTANSGQGQSEGPDLSDGDSKQSRKSKRSSTSKSNNKRKNEETPAKQTKKVKNNSKNDINMEDDDEDDDSDDDMGDMGKKGNENDNKKMTDEEKRKNFLERNRVAALKCRQRKKQWLANLQAKVEIFSSENDALNSQVSSLREEILNLKTILIAHKDCPISQSQPQTIGNYLPPNTGDYQNHPYMSMQQGQPVMTGPPRRFS